jgi:predicted ferric reductase
VYGIAALGLLAWLYREFAFARSARFTSVPIADTVVLNDNVTQVVLAGDVPRRAGQFAFITFQDGPSREDHPFTMSSGPGRDLRFSMKASGDFTEELTCGLPVNSIAVVEGPYGGFDFARGLERQLWLAGGIGITPFLAMADSLDGSREVELVWSVHDRAEAVYADELAGLAARVGGLSVAIHPTTELGHVDVGRLGTVRSGGDFSVFICGPVPMRQQALKQLASARVPRREIYFEEFRLR